MLSAAFLEFPAFPEFRKFPVTPGLSGHVPIPGSIKIQNEFDWIECDLMRFSYGSDVEFDMIANVDLDLN